MKKLTTILTLLSVVGVGVTAYFSTKAGADMEKADIHKEDFKDLNTFKKAAPICAPAVGAAVGTVTMIVAAQKLNTKHIAAVTAAGIGSAELVKRYRDKIEEVVGKDKIEELRKKLLDEHLDKHPESIESAKEEAQETNGSEMSLIYDEWNDRTFVTTEADCWKAIFKLNKLYFQRGYATHEEFYDQFEKVKLVGDQSSRYSGWDVDVGIDMGYEYIDMYLVPTGERDGINTYTLTYVFPPVYIREADVYA